MRIFRYRLEIQDYQQVQPVWPGRVLSVGANRYDTDGCELRVQDYGLDLWCTAALAHEAEAAGNKPAPILGIWVVGTGSVLPDGIGANDALFHGTVDLRDAHAGAWHVFSAVVGVAEQAPKPLGELGGMGDLVNKMRERHGGRSSMGVPNE